jgi:hypothetical protein
MNSTMPDFIPGLELSRRFYHEAVRPILDQHTPGLPHSAALIGSGSEVLGYDTPMSSDHHWGPRLLLFLSAADHTRHAAALDAALRDHLPTLFAGYSTHFSPPNPDDNGVQLLVPLEHGPVNHRVEITTLTAFCASVLAFDPARDPDPLDWLTFPTQSLLELTAGAVYHDEVGLNSLRARFAYYPDAVWRYLLAAGWTRIGQEEPFVGRTGDVGDEIGSQVIAARLVRDVMRLCFLIERRYAPYPKWFGTAFARLDCAAALLPPLQAALRAESWRERERALGTAYEGVAALHNALRLTDPLPAQVSPFHGRPFNVIHGERFAAALKATIHDELLRRIPFDIGAVDQWSDSTDLLAARSLRERLRLLYEG